MPALRPDGRTLSEIEQILVGGFPPLRGPLGRADDAAVRERRHLADGTPWPIPVRLAVPDELGAAAGSSLVIEDPERRPFALLAVSEVWAEDGQSYAAGELTGLREPVAGPYRRLRHRPDEVRAELGPGPVVAMVVDEPLQEADLEALHDVASDLGARILLMPMVAERGSLGLAPHLLVRSVLAAEHLLPEGALVVPVPLPHYADPLRRALVEVQVGAAYGATMVLLGDERISGADPDELAVPVLTPTSGQRISVSDLGAALDAGQPLPPELVPEAVVAELRRARPPKTQRGFTVFLTGLSGSGKSTIARSLRDALIESGRPEITLLDGDIVRDLLSAGLTYSREDRDLNVRRIGYVAAEVTRHGGVALAAPIAPYAASRAAARAEVEDAGGGFVLVHVATPLEECERRDVKGLYARARSGQLPAFTGISDPYEEPTDASLVLDTVTQSVEESISRILGHLRTEGWLA
jgi:sulfate adenylyltransferase